MNYADFYRRSLDDPEGFWAEQARGIEWRRPFARVLDYSRPPFARWFIGGETNLCHNALDRHLKERGGRPALHYVSTETGERRSFTYAELHREVNRFAAVLQSLGVGRGDRVILYMGMIPEAAFAMLACARIGAIHSVVFGGFAGPNLATRIDDARAKLLITTDAGMRGGKVIPYQPLYEEALRLAEHPPERVLVCRRGIAPGFRLVPGRDAEYAPLREARLDAEVPVAWLESNEPCYILYTSGTTGRPKGVQRDTGGHAVALEASMRHIYDGRPGETMFSTSDLGWVVGHSYILYGPLMRGMATILYEGLPIRPDPGVWWRLVSELQVSVMFSSPTAIRVLKKEDPRHLEGHDLSSLRHLFLAGEPLDEPTARWIAGALKRPVYDHYWQTESGWPILSYCPGVEPRPNRPGSPGFPVYGYRLRRVHETTGEPVAASEKGVLVAVPPLPPGCLSTVWGDDDRFVSGYFSNYKDLVYSTYDWATEDRDGYTYILGRSDDVINVAGHRLGTREIEEAVNAHPAVAEAAVVGVKDELKGQVVLPFVVLKDPRRIAREEDRASLEREISETVVRGIGPIARPARVHFVPLLPKTRSGKVLRRSIQALAEGRDPGDLTTLDDPAALEAVRALKGLVENPGENRTRTPAERSPPRSGTPPGGGAGD